MENLAFDGSTAGMEIAVVKDENQILHCEQFRLLWPGHYAKVIGLEDIFISKFSFGGGSHKYQFVSRSEWRGKPLLLYRHCSKKYPDVVILIHAVHPQIVVDQKITVREDGLVYAVSWNFATTAKHLTSKFFFASVPHKSLEKRLFVFCHVAPSCFLNCHFTTLCALRVFCLFGIN